MRSPPFTGIGRHNITQISSKNTHSQLPADNLPLVFAPLRLFGLFLRFYGTYGVLFGKNQNIGNFHSIHNNGNILMNKQDILTILGGIVHPEAKQNLVEGGFVAGLEAEGGKISVTLKFRRPRDPFAASLRRQAAAALEKNFPGAEIEVEVDEPPTKPAPPRGIPGVGRIIAVASGKGGVGKSTVAAYLAATMASEGCRVGMLDADIYGPSQPQLFGVEDYQPEVVTEEGADRMIPAESMGVKIMSIGFFIDPRDALVWRGPMATNALKQLIQQTRWGELDYLVIDLPPGTGDVHLTVIQDMELDGAIIVSTPQRLAVADVRRGVEMFRAEGIEVPVLGIVENMAWFTPAELPQNRYYIFGEGGARRFAEESGVDFLGDIPVMMSAMESGERGLPAQGLKAEVKPYYENVVRKVVEKLDKKCR